MSPDEIANRFAYHRPLSIKRVQAHVNVRSQIGRLAQFIAHHVPAGREQALAITKLEEAMFWANAGLARATDPDAGNAERVSAQEKGQRTYEAYGLVTGGKTHDGRDMPHWSKLGETVQAAWIAAASANIGGNP
jgi:hypothetical protein